MQARLREVRRACMSGLVGAPARNEIQRPHWCESGPWSTPFALQCSTAKTVPLSESAQRKTESEGASTHRE
jgi:hypothetical protein